MTGVSLFVECTVLSHLIVTVVVSSVQIPFVFPEIGFVK